MKFTQIKDEQPENFRRLTGIKRSTFNAMVKCLQEAETQRKLQGGKPNKLSLEDRASHGVGIFTGIPHLLSYIT